MRGLVVGRFQVVHNGHLHLLRRAWEDCEDVAIALGSTDAKPSTRNVLTTHERRQLLETVLAKRLPAGRTVRLFDVPDIHDPDRWVAHALGITGKVDAVYGNDEETLGLFDRAGLRTVRTGLHRREELTATHIRHLMTEDDPAWTKLVPAETVALLATWDIPARLRRLE